jgi:hypothetical protein
MQKLFPHWKVNRFRAEAFLGKTTLLKTFQLKLLEIFNGTGN